jgi:hypothetical protein
MSGSLSARPPKILDTEGAVSATLAPGQVSALCLLLLPPLMSGSPTRLATAASFSFNKLARCKSLAPALPDDP